MQPTSVSGSTYNLLSSSTLLRSLVTWRRESRRSKGRQRELTGGGGGGGASQLRTSYFCSFSFSMWSNFSDSSWHIHSCSSLILSLQETNHTWSFSLIRLGLFQKCWRTSACLRSGGRCSGPCVWQPGSSSSSLSQSLSYLLSSGQPDLTNTEATSQSVFHHI